MKKEEMETRRPFTPEVQHEKVASKRAENIRGKDMEKPHHQSLHTKLEGADDQNEI